LTYQLYSIIVCLFLFLVQNCDVYIFMFINKIFMFLFCRIVRSMFLITQVRYRSMIVPIVEYLSDQFVEGKNKNTRHLMRLLVEFLFFLNSVFVRDSTDCVLATVCQQFRTRDCRDLCVYLSCSSQPIIESSHNIKFACLTLNYNQLIGTNKHWLIELCFHQKLFRSI